MEIRPVDHVNATVAVPGSKSYTQRALVVASLAGGKSNLSNALIADDIRHIVEALRFLGAEIIISGTDVTVTGTDGCIHNPGRALLLGNNGTALRFLTTLAALGRGDYILDGSDRLRERPLAPLLNALRILGVESQSTDGYPPVKIDAGGLKGGRVSFADLDSSQYVSSLLIGAPYAEGDVEIALRGRTVSEPYVGMTMAVMMHFGAEVTTREKGLFHVKSGRHYKGQRYIIEGDASSASYFFLAAALCRGRVRVLNVNPASLQGDINILDIMENLGCSVTRGDTWVEVTCRSLRKGDVHFDMCNMPDMVPTLAVLAAFREGRTIITNVPHLRIKESDRIAALVNELKKIGVAAMERADGLVIVGGKLRGACIETYNDHRIAMSFAVAGLALPGIRIEDRRCVGKSFPGFWDELSRLSGD